MEPTKYAFSKELVTRLVDMIQDGLLRGKDISESLMNLRLVEVRTFPVELVEATAANVTDDQYKLAPDVLARIVQILQEALVMGMDIAELLLAIRLDEESTLYSDPLIYMLKLTNEYKDNIKREHENLVQRAQELPSQNEPTIIKL